MPLLKIPQHLHQKIQNVDMLKWNHQHAGTLPMQKLVTLLQPTRTSMKLVSLNETFYGGRETQAPVSKTAPRDFTLWSFQQIIYLLHNTLDKLRKQKHYYFFADCWSENGTKNIGYIRLVKLVETNQCGSQHNTVRLIISLHFLWYPHFSSSEEPFSNLQLPLCGFFFPERI